MADHCFETTMNKDEGLANGLNIYYGTCTHKNLEMALGIDFVDINTFIKV